MTFLQENILLARFKPLLFRVGLKSSPYPRPGAAGLPNFQLARAEFSN
jgi:hypothetical protein